MSEGVTITALELENVKRVRAVSLTPAATGLTVVGGRNAQGKTSVLDAIVWALGGDRYKPTNPVRDGEEKLHIRLELSNGLVVERSGKNGALKVSGGNGGGQGLLNSFVSELALNLPKFMAASESLKAQMLLDCFPGLGKRLQELNQRAKELYDSRLAVGRIADQKAKHAADLPFHPDAPEMPLTGSEMTARMEEALRVNSRNRELRAEAQRAPGAVAEAAARVRAAQGRVAEIELQLAEAKRQAAIRAEELERAQAAADAAAASAAALQDADTTSLKAELERIDEINAKVRTNLTKSNAEDEAARMRQEYEALAAQLDEVRAERLRLLAEVEMPLPGLEVADAGELLYNGQRWDCMSGAEQLRVSAAICAQVKPQCRFVLLDRLEALDRPTLEDFGLWLEGRGLQAIGTRVSDGDECSIIIEDGVGRVPDAPEASLNF
jgi:hypothetical protein